MKKLIKLILYMFTIAIFSMGVFLLMTKVIDIVSGYLYDKSRRRNQYINIDDEQEPEIVKKTS